MVTLLTAKQQKIFDHMLEAGTFTATNGHDHHICRGLVEKGRIVLIDSRVNAWVYLLAPEFAEKKSRKARGVPADQRNLIPDPPKNKIKRPPAIYSNPSYDELIDKILKNR